MLIYLSIKITAIYRDLGEKGAVKYIVFAWGSLLAAVLAGIAVLVAFDSTAAEVMCCFLAVIGYVAALTVIYRAFKAIKSIKDNANKALERFVADYHAESYLKCKNCGTQCSLRSTHCYECGNELR